jgi:hypothetical protein
MIRPKPQIAQLENRIQSAFPSHTVLHAYTPDHLIIKATIRDLLQAPISNWQYNRPADLVRCEEIANYIYRQHKPVDTPLYLSLNRKTNRFDMIDGIHRYTALMHIQELTVNEIPDYITPTDTCNWLFDSYMIFVIRKNATDGELVELFQSLNKSNPIPELYVRDFKKDKQDAVEHVCHHWQTLHKTHFSPSNKPQKPNINRDRFMDLLGAVWDKHHLTEETKGTLETILQQTNAHISQHVPAKTTKAIREKCEGSGCWLFLYTPDELIKMM